MISKTNDNAYKLALPGESKIIATFSVADLAPFDVGDVDSKANLFDEGGNDGTENDVEDLRNGSSSQWTITRAGAIEVIEETSKRKAKLAETMNKMDLQ